MDQRSHVPKFGNWDGDNVPYTAYFENARKEKTTGIRINPNDPEQNPEAFGVVSISPDNEVASLRRFGAYDDHHKHKDGGRRTLSSGSSSNGTNSVNPNPKPKQHQHKKSTSESTNPPISRINNNADDFSHKSVSIPKFGQWDEQDPRSGEGFTVIFNKVKEEKHIAASKLPPLPLQHTNNYKAAQEKQTREKCCCFF